jgi:DNA-directed RNA polymerase subunit RPC12/RpoP
MCQSCETVIRLKQWVQDLQSGMYVNCVYCGHRYGPKDKTPVSMADLLKQHIEVCPEHPLMKQRAMTNAIAEMAGSALYVATGDMAAFKDTKDYLDSLANYCEGDGRPVDAAACRTLIHAMEASRLSCEKNRAEAALQESTKA